jgi:hypothetical protein
MLVWGSRVSQDFRNRVINISQSLGIDPDFLMACIAFESGETFSPSVKNAAGSGAIGLIQFMPQTAALLGTSSVELAGMTAEEQLGYVYKYFLPHTGKMKTLSDLYMAILWPAAIGKAETYVLFSQTDSEHPKRYIQNRGLDFNHDGVITKAEAAAGPQHKLEKGVKFSA